MNKKNSRTINPQVCSTAKRYRRSTNTVQQPLVRADNSTNSHTPKTEVIVILSDSEDEDDEAPQTVQQEVGVTQAGGYREEDEDEEEEMLLRAVKNNLKNEKLKEEQKQTTKEVIEILSDSEDENETVVQTQRAPEANRVVKVLPQGLNTYQENNIAYPTNHYFHNITNNIQANIENQQQYQHINESTVNNINNISNNKNSNKSKTNINIRNFNNKNIFIKNSSNNYNITNNINHIIYSIRNNNNNNNNSRISNNVFTFKDMRQALQVIEDDLYFMEVDPYPSHFSQKRKRNHDAEHELGEQLQRGFYSKRQKFGELSWMKISTVEDGSQVIEMTDAIMNISKSNSNNKYRNIRHKSRRRRRLF